MFLKFNFFFLVEIVIIIDRIKINNVIIYKIILYLFICNWIKFVV